MKHKRPNTAAAAATDFRIGVPLPVINSSDFFLFRAKRDQGAFNRIGRFGASLWQPGNFSSLR
jgi:hypothetical protein